MVIFEKSRRGRVARSQSIPVTAVHSIQDDLLRKDTPLLPEMSELDAVRHYTRLSRSNFSIDTHPYPLGSCTMKYNPRAAHRLAQLPPFLSRHPLRPAAYSQGFMKCLYELQEALKLISGMEGVSLSPMAGAQGEFAGVAMIGAYHAFRQDFERDEMLVPDAAHGTNPASAAMCGFKVKEVPTLKEGDLDLDALQKMVGPRTAGIMLTNPSTLGVFERQIEKVANMVHEAGGLLYYDGANLNAIVGQVSPGAMGFDVIHMNLHKTFATPHGGGGPGSGPVACNAKLLPFLPVPRVDKSMTDDAIQYDWFDSTKFPLSIGRLSAFMGNAGILLRAYIYIKMLGREGLERVSQFATLNANYLMKRLGALGYTLAFPERRASHEFIISLKKEAKTHQITAMDIAKRLLDYQLHAPTTYFPLIVPECLLIEPTETESKQTLDFMVDVFKQIAEEIETSPDIVKKAPHNFSVSRLDDVRAARQLELTWQRHEA
ncbi:MAG: aminomethyl-transferring glycine dehydrogenase subunit GcvPB [Gammaproteobacteria bacterium]